MTINKYTGKTREEAIEKAKADLGPQVVIMNVKEIHPAGLFGVFRKSTFEVTGAIEDDLSEPYTYERRHEEEDKKAKGSASSAAGNFSAVADEKIVIPPASEDQSQVPSALSVYAKQGKAEPKTETAPRVLHEKEETIDAKALESAFKEVGEVIGARNIDVSNVKDFDPDQKVIHAKQIEAVQPAVRPEPVAPSYPRPVEFPKPPETDRTAGQLFGERSKEYIGFVKMVYNILLEHEVDEKYVNLMLSDLDRLISAGKSMDYIISNVYQKMALKIGQPREISFEKKPAIVFLIGPTGVGKTTTLAKLASRYKISEHKKVAFLTADTFRIAATEQLSVYANILEVDSVVLLSPEDLKKEIGEHKDCDLIMVDTLGFSHKNETQKASLKQLLDAVPEKYDKQVYLVLSATTKYKDLKMIVDAYRSFTDFNLIFTKLDETSCYGNIFNIRMYSDAPLSYVTDGQNVPEDIAVLDAQKLVKNLLGGD